MTVTRQLILLSFLLLAVLPARPADEGPLTPGITIELPTVRGRIDHFGIDLGRSRLYVAAIRNDTVEVVDLKAGARKRSIHGFVDPQGALYVPGLDRLFVSNGRGDRVEIMDGESLARTKRIEGLEDADNLRLDAATRKVYVGYGKGAIRVLDATTGDSVGDIPLSGHPEAFQLEVNGPRIFVNVPTAQHVAVVDRAKGAVVATWATADAEANFPMALDEKGKRLFVGTRFPPLLLVYDTETGNIVAKQEIGKDADDIFFDPAHKRLYVICGEGRIDLLHQLDPDHYSAESAVITALGARTGLLVPENRRLYVAAPAIGDSVARVLTYDIH
jgi:DNA-binding beta-propeller fold protein YncE